MAENSPSARYEIWGAPLLTWGALCVLLAVTTVVAYIPLSYFNLPLSLGIAILKSALIGSVFMRLAQGNALHRLAASAGPIWIFIMFLLLGADYFTR